MTPQRADYCFTTKKYVISIAIVGNLLLICLILNKNETPFTQRKTFRLKNYHIKAYAVYFFYLFSIDSKSISVA